MPPFHLLCYMNMCDITVFIVFNVFDIPTTTSLSYVNVFDISVINTLYYMHLIFQPSVHCVYKCVCYPNYQYWLELHVSVRNSAYSWELSGRLIQ